MILKLLRELMESRKAENADANSGKLLSPPEEDSIAQLVVNLYPELRRIAGSQMQRERLDHTWQPTALVNEVFLKLGRIPNIKWRDKSHFLMAASRAMRLLLIDYSRTHNAQHNSGRLLKVSIEDADTGQCDRVIEYLELDELLSRLADVDQRMATVVELRVFGGLSFAEIGEVLAVSDRTAKRDWQVARAWLFGELGGGTGNDGGGLGTN
jgi:RNA polymerase sigma-70 factor, ECF subfamily